MTPTVAVRERVARHAPFGVRLWDVAADRDVVDGLDVDIVARAPGRSRARAVANRRGVYCAAGVPGLREFELNGPADPTAWSGLARRYRIEVRDTAERFLPIAFDADLPARGLFTWRTPWTSPPRPLLLPTDHHSPPSELVGRVPLFSAPNRPVPDPLAAVRAQVRELGSERAAAWCVLTASIDGVVRGMGVADGEGRVAVLFPYPDRPRPLLASPPSAINDFRWSVQLTAYYVPRPAGAAAPAVPDLADVLGQLAAPRTLWRSTAPLQPLPAQPLEYRVPLTVRTEVTAAGPSSFLFVNTA